MKDNEFKYVVGEVSNGKPAYMRLYGRIDDDNTRRFNDEFLWLQDYIKPSRIVISINSEGGSVVCGMGTYSIIRNSPIETETIVEGLAASMGSIIWAAGTRSYMRDYSILMIHNPFKTKTEKHASDEEEEDADTKQMLNAFRNQIATIYTKRFGLPKDTVKKIMDGEEGCDGTYFDAKSAVSAGILSEENIIKTSKQIRSKVKNQMEGLVEACQIQEMMASINAELEDFKPNISTSPIPDKKCKIINSNSQKMEKEQDVVFGAICGQLGLDKTAEVADVVNTINTLKETSQKLNEVKDALNAMKIQKEGAEAQLENVKNELTSVKAELQTYKDAEKAQHDAEIEALVDNAIADGKISSDAKSKWVEMAQTNFEMVKDTLASIEKQEKISEKIADDPANIDNAVDGMTEAEKRMKAAVDEVVGKDFQFATLD